MTQNRIAGRNEMRYPFVKIAVGCVLTLALMGSAAYAQPTRRTKRLSRGRVAHLHCYCDGNYSQRPAAEVWKRVGKYCDVSEWLQAPAPCKIISVRTRVWRVRSQARRSARGPNGALLHLYANPEGGHTVQPLSRTIEARPVTRPRPRSSTPCSSITRCCQTTRRARRIRKHGARDSPKRCRT